MKRITSFILAFALVFSIVPSTLAISDEATQAAQALHELGLFNGVGTNADGTPIFELDRTPTRHEAITMLVCLLGKEEEARLGTWETPFTDVANWAKPYVGYAYANKLTGGTSNTTFGGEETVTAAQYITFALLALGYTSGTDFRWDRSWELADQIKLTDGRYNAETNEFTRGDVAIISLSALSVPMKGTNQPLSQKISPKVIAEETPAVTSKVASNQLKTDILQSIRDGMVHQLEGLETLSGILNIASYSSSLEQKIAYMIVGYQELQKSYTPAINCWQQAIELCSDYSDTQKMKTLLISLIDTYSPLADYGTIDVNNLIDYADLEHSIRNQGDAISDNITAEMETWINEIIKN